MQPERERERLAGRLAKRHKTSKQVHRWTDGQKDRWTDGQKDR